MVKAIGVLQPTDIKLIKKIMQIFSLNETMAHLAMANSVPYYGQVLMRDDVHE